MAQLRVQISAPARLVNSYQVKVNELQSPACVVRGAVLSAIYVRSSIAVADQNGTGWIAKSWIARIEALEPSYIFQAVLLPKHHHV